MRIMVVVAREMLATKVYGGGMIFWDKFSFTALKLFVFITRKRCVIFKKDHKQN